MLMIESQGIALKEEVTGITRQPDLFVYRYLPADSLANDAKVITIYQHAYIFNTYTFIELFKTNLTSYFSFLWLINI